MHAEVEVEARELAHLPVVVAEELARAGQVAEALLAGVGHDEQAPVERYALAQQVARREEQPHEVCRVVADARREKARLALGERQGLGVGEDHVGVRGKDRDAVVAVLGAGQAENDVVGLVDAHGADGRALGEQPVADELRPPLLVAGRRRDLRERAQQLELLLVALISVLSCDASDLLVHRASLPCVPLG